MTLSRSWMRCLALAAGTLIGASMLATGSAHAEPLTLLQCQGTESLTYSPGLTFTRRDITITTTAQFSSCTDSTGKVTSGSYGEQFTIFISCNDLLDGFTAQRTFMWNTGDTSVIEGTGQSTAVADQVITTITATVTQGRFQGHTAVEVIPLPQAGFLQCLTTGVTSASGVTTLTIT